MSTTLLVANKIGSLWIPFLIKDRVLVGEVVNVYHRTINIRCVNDMLLSITTLNYSSPIHINVVSGVNGINFQKHIRPYEEVFFEKPHVVMGDVRIDADLIKAKIHFPRAFTMCGFINTFIDDYSFLQGLYKKTLFFVNIIDKTNNILELAVKAGLKERIHYILNKIREHVTYDNKDRLVLEKIYRLLGLGYGVTPSTDDFIGGLLGTLNIYLACNKRKPIILNRRKILSKTNWVSGYLLYYNNLGLFNSIFEEFIENVFKKNLSGSIDSFLSLISIGHTSGLDMSLGALSALAVIEENIVGGKIIDKYFDLFF